jgi:hypothetical protein
MQNLQPGTAATAHSSDAAAIHGSRLGHQQLATTSMLLLSVLCCVMQPQEHGTRSAIHSIMLSLAVQERV